MKTHKLTAKVKDSSQIVEVIGFHRGAHRMACMATCKDASGNIADIHLSQLEGLSGSLKVGADIVISFFGKEVSA